MSGLSLTRLRVPKELALKLKLFDPYAWHQALWRAFSNGGAPSKREFLFRVDDLGREYRAYLLSQNAPNHQTWGVWETKSVGAEFLAKKAFRFQLRANPVVRKSEPDHDGKRVPGRLVSMTKEPDLRDWLGRKALSGGFAIDQASLAISPASMIRFRKDGREGSLNQVEFSGVLTVQDRALFLDAFSKGIGRAKAFGFGLLILVPA